MMEFTKLMLASTLAGTLALSGCGGETDSVEDAAHSDDAGHVEGVEGIDEHASHDHGEDRALGSLAIGDAVFEVSVSGEYTPGSELHIDLAQTSGSTPSGVRMWIGDEAATGSLKSKADGHDSHFHGHAEAPASLGMNTALWIEIETEDGERETAFVSLGG